MKFFICFVGLFALSNAGLLTPQTWMNLDAGRIVGGDEAAPHSKPYQVALLVEMGGKTAFCGGSLISPNYVMTAAHCVEPASSIEVVLGAHKINEKEDTQVRMTSTEFVVHAKWSMFTLQNDIALIKLPQAVELNENIQLSKLPTRAEAKNNFEGVTTTATGWGKDSDKASAVSPVLREVSVPVEKKFWCNLRYFGVIQDTHICTVGKGGKSTCSGDSGGPLVTADEPHTQVGIVSFGISFGCEIGWPAVYTRVTSYLDWIEDNTDVVIADKASSIEVVLGAHKINEKEDTQVRMTSTEFVVHAKWSMFTLQNDIALIKLPQAVELNENIQLSKLPTRAEAKNNFEGVTTTATGWGKDSDKASAVSPVLREVSVPVEKKCWCNLRYFGVIQDTHICTVGKGGKSTCSGDSGGPLVTADEPHTQVGIVSFGISFGCEIGWPAVYTCVTSYLDWIEDNTDVVIADK